MSKSLGTSVFIPTTKLLVAGVSKFQGELYVFGVKKFSGELYVSSMQNCFRGNFICLFLQLSKFQGELYVFGMKKVSGGTLCV